MNCVPSGPDQDPVETTIDRILGARVLLRQPTVGYRVAIDTVLLAAAVPARAGDRVLELGCGVGGAMLCLGTRVSECAIVGVERQDRLADLARENIIENKLSHRLVAKQGDIRAMSQCLDQSYGFDHVMLNPPFHEAGEARESPDPVRALAMTERNDMGIGAWLRIGLGALRRKGMLTVIAPAARLPNILDSIEGKAGRIELIPLWPRGGNAAKPAKRVIVRMRAGMSGALTLYPGLVLHAASGGFTPEAEAILRNVAPLAPESLGK